MPDNIDAEGYKRFEREGYSNVADRYIGTSSNIFGQSYDAILDAAHVSAGKAVVDIACGPGLLAATSVKRGATATGLDFAPTMVEVARKAFPEATFQEADGENLPFEAETFDAAVCSLGLLHFPNPEKGVSEAFRVLKSKGHYAFTCWTPPASNPLMALVFGSIQKHGDLDVDIPAGPPLFRFGEPSECEKVLREAGFGNIAVSQYQIDWVASSPESFFEDILSSTGRLAPLLALQTPKNRAAIKSAMIESARGYLSADGVSVPAPVLIASGQKP